MMNPGLTGSNWWSSFLRLSPRNSSSRDTNQPTRKSAQIFPELNFAKSLGIISMNTICGEHLGFHVSKSAWKILQRTIKRLNRPTVRWCIAWLKMHKMHLKCKNATFLCETCFKTELGANNAVKPKSKNKKQTIWVLIGENNTRPSSFILYWWFQFLPYVIVNTILSNKLMKRLQHVAMECYHFSCC